MGTTQIEAYRKVDSRLAELNIRRNRLLSTLSGAKNTLKHWGYANVDTARMAWESGVKRQITTIDEATAKIEAIELEMKTIESNEYTGWNRFFYVKHLHNTTHCSSFRWNTQIAWCPEISGLTEDDAVAEYGATLCTICFKSAPTK